MRIEVEDARFFAELSANQTVVGISADDDAQPVLTVVDERTDESISVPVTTELLERLGAFIHLHNKWRGDKSRSSNVTHIRDMRYRHRNDGSRSDQQRHPAHPVRN